MKRICSLLFSLFLFCNNIEASSIFDELDKPPEGAHAGQMFLGGFVSMGIPFGDMLSHEEDFVKKDYYTFEDIGVSKEFLVTHLSYDYGITFEYMPMDHIGIKSKLKRVIVVQRTLFGANYRNWNESLFESTSLMVGPSFHLTNRKMWDITFTPMLGYSVGKYSAAPIAAELSDSFTGSRGRDVNSLIYGAELLYVSYFSGGLYISAGLEWTSYPLKFSPPYNLERENNNNTFYFMENKSSATLHTMNLVISAGYAFDH